MGVLLPEQHQCYVICIERLDIKFSFGLRLDSIELICSYIVLAKRLLQTYVKSRILVYTQHFQDSDCCVAINAAVVRKFLLFYAIATDWGLNLIEKSISVERDFSSVQQSLLWET